MTAGGWNKGIPRTAEEKAKMSAAKKGKPSTFKGRHHSDESKLTQRLAKLGKKMSDSARENMSRSHAGRVAWNKGVPQSLEWKEKNRVAHLGKHPSDATRAKLSKSLRKRVGDTHTDRCLRAWYGITETQYNEMLLQQNGVCAICGNINGSGRRLCVDHDHATKKVRGLLCDSCNRGLGYLGDQPARVERAANYLKTNMETL